MVRASLAASATTTVFTCARAVRLRSQLPSGVSLLESVGRAARAPWISILRRYPLPRLLIPSSFGLPPLVICRGTNPSQAARSRPRPKVSALPIAATSAVAFSGPIPGIVNSSRAASSVRDRAVWREPCGPASVATPRHTSPNSSGRPASQLCQPRKKGAIEQLYTAPPERSVVVCLDEMGPQASKSYPGQRLVKPAGPRAERARQEIDYGRRARQEIDYGRRDVAG